MSVETFPIEAGNIMAFARSIGDPNPIYYDEAYALSSEIESVIAPPTYVQASAQFDPDYQLRPKLDQTWFGSGKTASDAPQKSGGVWLHAEQHFEYHGVLRPDDVLLATTTEGKTWEKQGRSGRLSFGETITDYRNQNGDLVVRARAVRVHTEGAQ